LTAIWHPNFTSRSDINTNLSCYKNHSCFSVDTLTAVRHKGDMKASGGQNHERFDILRLMNTNVTDTIVDGRLKWLKWLKLTKTKGQW